MSKTLGLGWSPENAEIIEGWLTAVLESVSGVSDVRGCSSDTLRDYKVAFSLEDDQSIIGAYLRYLPDGRDFLSRPNQPAILLAHTGSGETWPEVVSARIQEAFPHCVRETRKGIRGDAIWHYWSLISIYDLRTFAESRTVK